MKLEQIYEENIPNVYKNKSVNSLNKKPKKLKKNVYGTGLPPMNISGTGNTGEGTDGGSSDGGGSGAAGAA